MHHKTNFDLPYYIQKFVVFLQIKGLSKDTIEAYSRKLKVFSDFIDQKYKGNILLEQLQRRDLRDYLYFLLHTKNLKHNTVHSHLATLKSFFKFFVEEKDLSVNIAANIPFRKETTSPPPILTEDEVKRLLQSAKKDSFYFFVLIKLIYLTGSHFIQAIKLRKEDVNLKDGTIYFPSSKVNRGLYLSINASLAPTLKQFLDDHPLPESPYLFPSPSNPGMSINKETVRNRLQKIKQSAGIEKQITPHILRKSMIVHLIEHSINHNITRSTFSSPTHRHYFRLIEDNQEYLFSTLVNYFKQI